MKDYAVGDTIDYMWTTINAVGAPSALTSGAVAVYKDNNTTESTAGVTLTASFDSKTGLNHLRVTMVSDGTFYSSGSTFHAWLTAGTVDGTSVTPYVVYRWTVGKDIHPNASGYANATVKQIVTTTVQGDGSGTPWGPST